MLLCAELVLHGWPPLLAFALVLLIGCTFGLVQGAIIHYFEIQPFIVTLATLTSGVNTVPATAIKEQIRFVFTVNGANAFQSVYANVLAPMWRPSSWRSYGRLRRESASLTSR